MNTIIKAAYDTPLSCKGWYQEAALQMLMIVVADGTDETARREERVLTTDPGIGIM